MQKRKIEMYDDPEFRNTGAPAGCMLVLFIVLLVLVALACVYTFYWHPSVEWLQSIDEPGGSYIIFANFFDTLACNHAARVCVGIPL